MYYDAWYDQGVTMWPWSTKDGFIPSEEVLAKAQGREVNGLKINEMGVRRKCLQGGEGFYTEGAWWQRGSSVEYGMARA